MVTKLSHSKDGDGRFGRPTSMVVPANMEAANKGGMGPTAARTHRSATTTDQQGRGHYNVAVGVGGGQREGKSGPILVVAGVGMHARSSVVNRRVCVGGACVGGAAKCVVCARGDKGRDQQLRAGPCMTNETQRSLNWSQRRFFGSRDNAQVLQTAC